MAILEGCPGLKVEVTVNEHALREYDDDNVQEKPNTLTKYVEVNGNDTFEVRAQFLDNYVATYDVGIKLWLDGNKINSYLLPLKSLKNQEIYNISGVRSKTNGIWHIYNLVFSSLAIEIDSARKLDQATSDQLQKTGNITVLFYRIKNIRPAPGQVKISHVSTFDKVPEKTVQTLGLSHQAGLGEPEELELQKCTSSFGDFVDSKDERAFATFNFKYRSLAALKSLHIVPRTPTPTPTPAPLRSLPYTPNVTHVAEPRDTDSDGTEGLDAAEIIVMIGAYRGNTNGLEGCPQKELLALLRYYRTKNPAPKTRVKRERGSDAEHSGDARRIKRDGTEGIIDLTQ